MMIKSKLILILFCSFFMACSTTISKKLDGTWSMAKVYDNSDDVTAEHNPKNDRWITFSQEGTFKSGGGVYGENAGKWIFTPSANILYLDSDAGQGDDSYWVLQVDKDGMNWSGARSSFTERFKIYFKKK